MGAYMSAVLIKIARFLGNALLVLFGLATLGSFFPAMPVLGEMGPVLSSFFGPWITIFSAVSAVLLLRHWRKIHRKRTLIIAALAAFAAIGTIFIQVQQISVAKANGVGIDLSTVLLAGSQSDTNLHPITINYSSFEGQPLPLDIYKPIGVQSNALAPVFVYIHGGGWGGQTLKQREADYSWFATRGYLVISLEYTLSTDKRHTWNVATPELGCALAWVGANAARYGGDASRLALWGESAGGNLVLNLSYMANQGTLKPSCVGKVPHIVATVALYPVVDPARMYRPVDPMLGVFGRMMGDNYTGGSPESLPDRYAAIASATHINAAAPPTLLIVPEADHLVVPQAAFDFADKAKAAGVDIRLIRWPYAEHAFDLSSGSIGNQFVREAMLHFLSDHGLKP
jgi:acetyl esterase/lipase